MLLVQMAGLAMAASAGAQAATPTQSDYGAQDTGTHGTVITMPRTDARKTDSDAGSVPATSAPVATPPRGMTMNHVIAEYGKPITRHAPVGQPPITRWDYSGYRLYFEYDHVLHAVVPQQPEPVAHADELAHQGR